MRSDRALSLNSDSDGGVRHREVAEADMAQVLPNNDP